MASSTLIGGQDQATVERMLLDSSQFEKGLQDCAKLIRQQQRHEKDLELVRAELEKRTQSFSAVNQRLTETMSDIGKTMSIANLASSALERGIGLVKDAMVNAAREGVEYSEFVRGHEKAIYGMSESLGGMVKATEIAKAQTALMGSELHATAEQMDAIGKAAVVYGDRMHISVGQALTSITDKLVGGDGLPKLMRELGIEFTETSNKTFSSMSAIDKMARAFGDAKPEIKNTKQALQEAESAWDDFTGAAGAAVLAVVPLKGELHGLAAALREVTAQGFSGSWRPEFWSPTRIVKGLVDKQIAEAKKRVERAGTMQLPELVVEYNDKKTSGKRPELTFAEKRLLQEYELQIETERKANEAAVRLTESRDRAAKEQLEFSIWVSEAQKKTLREEVAADEERKAGYRERYEAAGDARRFLSGGQQDAMSAAVSKMDRMTRSLDAGTAAYKRIAAAGKLFYDEINGVGLSALGQMYSGLISVADAAALGQESWITGSLKLGKAMLYSISEQCFGLAIREAGMATAAYAQAANPMNIITGLSAGYATEGALHTDAAITFGLMAGGTALAGIGMAAAGVGGGGGASGAPPSSASTGESYRPSYGQREEQQPITVENIVYIGGKGDLGAVPWQRAIIQSQVKQRN